MKETFHSFIFLLTSFLFIVNSLSGQNLTTAPAEEIGFSKNRLIRIDNVFNDYVKNQKMAGSVILVARKGKVAYYKSFGYRDIESDSPMQKDAIFRIASQTKAIVSVGIMILQEEGKLLIQEPVSKYIPEFEKTTVAKPDGNGGYSITQANREINIHDLLTHTAGIGYGYGPAEAEWEQAGIQDGYFANRDEPISKTIEKIASLPMDAQPGTEWIYGYSTDILGVVIERASGMALNKFLQTRIFDPLAMKDTYFYLPGDKVDRLATVYVPEEGKPLKSASRKEQTMNGQGDYVEGPRKSFSGGAGLLSTAKDYYLFLQMLANEGELNGERILSRQSVNLMTTDHLGSKIKFRDGEGFGLGFSVVTNKGLRGTLGSIGEYGWGGAYGSTYWIDPVEDLIVVYFTQLRPYSIVKDQLMLRTLIYQSLTD